MDKAVAQALCGYVQKGGAALIALGGNSARAGKIPLAGERFTSERVTKEPAMWTNRLLRSRAWADFQNVQFLDSCNSSQRPARVYPQN